MESLLRAQVSTLSQRARRSFTDYRVITRHRKSTAGKVLRALRGLVWGFLVRKRAAATLYSIQALFRAQAAILFQRARRSFPNHRVSRHRKSIEMRFDQETYSRFAKSNRLIAPITRA